MSNTLKLYITTVGDRSVGIYPTVVKIESNLVVNEANRENYRRDFTEAIKEIVDDEIGSSVFNDECPDCVSVLNDEGKCPNNQCIQNVHEKEITDE